MSEVTARKSKLLSLHHSYYFLLSGVLTGAGVNILTGLVDASMRASWPSITGAAILWFITAWKLTTIGQQVDEAHQRAVFRFVTDMNPETREEIVHDELSKEEKKVTSSFCAALCTFVLGFVVLFFLRL